MSGARRETGCLRLHPPAADGSFLDCLEDEILYGKPEENHS